ncbi:MAG: hypothetical protein K8U03_10855 [Planctomycetia bacterium]|nr:hypothetical protein [Planctomycetia bacterium]
MDQVELLSRIASVLESLPARYAVVGSIASMLYGEPRLTLDIDIVVELEDRFVDALCERFPAPEHRKCRQGCASSREAQRRPLTLPSTRLK